MKTITVKSRLFEAATPGFTPVVDTLAYPNTRGVGSSHAPGKRA